MPRVLISDYVHPVLICGLTSQGYEVLYAPEIEQPQLLEWIGGYDGIVVNTKVVVDPQLLEHASHLKWVARLGSGLDTINQQACADRDIRVISTPQANANAVAEHVFGMLLSLLRNIVVADHEVRQGIWNREGNRGQELSGRTVGIIGFGNNGGAFGRKFAGWNVRVLAYDKYKSDYTGDLDFVTESDLDTVLQEAEVLSLHVPLTAETHYMVNSDFLARCRPGCILINSSRGKVVQTSALLEALESGLLGGACLDVLENEKFDTYHDSERLVYSRLTQLPNVVCTPHIAGWTIESKMRIANQIVEEVSGLV